MQAIRFKHGLRATGLWLVLAFSVSVLAGGVFAAPTPPPWAKEFLGFWQGVDVLDGSTVHVSLSDIEGDGVLELRQQEGFYTICFDQGAGFSQGRGFITGSGRVTARGVLDLATKLFCVSDQNVKQLIVEDTVQYTLRGQILLLPQFDDNPRVLLHRTSL